jgi:hypothetical protein
MLIISFFVLDWALQLICYKDWQSTQENNVDLHSLKKGNCLTYNTGNWNLPLKNWNNYMHNNKWVTACLWVRILIKKKKLQDFLEKIWQDSSLHAQDAL